MLKVLRRRTEITTSYAPTLGQATDVPPTPPRPAPPPVATAPAHASLPSGPPSWTPGRCYHPVHVVLDGVRYGLLPEPGDYPHRASLLRCLHVNPDGH